MRGRSQAGGEVGGAYGGKFDSKQYIIQPPETGLLLFDGKIVENAFFIETFNEIKFKVILWALHEILEIMLLQVILIYTAQSF